MSVIGFTINFLISLSIKKAMKNIIKDTVNILRIFNQASCITILLLSMTVVTKISLKLMEDLEGG